MLYQRIICPAPPIVFFEFHEVDERCPLCSMRNNRPQTLYLVHELWRRGQQGAGLMTEVSAIWEEYKLGRPPALEAVALHFGAHVRIATAVPRSYLSSDEADAYDDYADLRDLYSEFRALVGRGRETQLVAEQNVKAVITALGEAAEELRDSPEDGDAREQAAESMQQLSIVQKTYDMHTRSLVKLITELRSMLRSLSEMRSTERLTTAVIKKHTDHLIMELASPLRTEIQSQLERVRRESPSAGAVLQELVDRGLYSIFERAAENAMARSREAYRLH